MERPDPGRVAADPVAFACKLVRRELAPGSVRLILFGSRARGDADARSDVDLAIAAEQPVAPETLARIRDVLEESCIPQKVDVVDLVTASEELRSRILAEGVECSA